MQTANYDAARRGMSHTSPHLAYPLLPIYAEQMAVARERERVPFKAFSCCIPLKERVVFNNLNYLRTSLAPSHDSLHSPPPIWRQQRNLTVTCHHHHHWRRCNSAKSTDWAFCNDPERRERLTLARLIGRQSRPLSCFRSFAREFSRLTLTPLNSDGAHAVRTRHAKGNWNCNSLYRVTLTRIRLSTVSAGFHGS